MRTHHTPEDDQVVADTHDAISDNVRWGQPDEFRVAEAESGETMLTHIATGRRFVVELWELRD